MAQCDFAGIFAQNRDNVCPNMIFRPSPRLGGGLGDLNSWEERPVSDV